MIVNQSVNSEFALRHMTGLRRALSGKRDRSASCVLLCILVPLLTGCGGREGVPELGTVYGTVTLDGQPLPRAIVKFQPQTGRASYGETDEDGDYVLLYVDDVEGALPGTHVVSISADTKRIPDRYNKRTAIQREVVAGSNEFDFPLESDQR